MWAETSTGDSPLSWRGRLPKEPRPKTHPFSADHALLQALVEKRKGAKVETLTLRLPTTRSGPQPSPGLVHSWDLDRQTPLFLAPWIIPTLHFSPTAGFPLLLELASIARDGAGISAPLVLGDDARYWHTAAAFALEALAGQKLAPVLAPAGKTYHARWMPVFDNPQDAPRLARLKTAMPPVCRSEAPRQRTGKTPAAISAPADFTPDGLLTSFLNTCCDALARRWASPRTPRRLAESRHPAFSWLLALFESRPSFNASQAQLQALSSSYLAWIRSLYITGNASFRVAFRLEAPNPQFSEAENSAQSSKWRLHYLLQARDDPSLLLPAETVWQRSGSVLHELGRRFEQPQERLLAGLGYAARLFPAVASSLKSKTPTHLDIDTQQAYHFLRQAAPVLESAGFGLQVPPWWNKPGARLGVRLRLRPSPLPNEKTASSGKLTKENLLRYQWELSLGETQLTEAEFRTLAALKAPLVQIRGQWVQLDPEQVEAAIRFWEKQTLSGEAGLLQALQWQSEAEAAVEGLPVDEVIAEGWLAEWLERLKQPEKLDELPQPDELKGSLRPYQRFGYSWLHFLRRYGIGACLADDMGLGKTIQTLALLLKEKEILGRLPAPALLVCPTSVVNNWQREVQRFAPSLTTLVHQGSGRLRGQPFLEASHQVDLVITSYALVRQDAAVLQKVDWLGVILDEAQNIKNPSARQTQSVRGLPAAFRLALTGTPVENRLSELWSIMHFLNPGYLGTRQDFRSRYALPIERYQDEKAVQALKERVGPLILRRVKTDPSVIQDLPEKLEMKVYCHLTEEQATLYQAVVDEQLEQIDVREGMERRGQVLSMLLQLKQICNHPDHYLHQVGKGDERANLRDNTKFSERSGKLERLVEMLEEIVAEGDHSLIFTQFAEMGQLLANRLPGLVRCPVQFLHGGTPSRVRDQMVRRFQEDEHAPPIFILSLKAGGTGINLTRASHVFHFDRWWNPAVEDQATDRAYRIGQSRNVQVHKLVTAGTLEEMIDELIESKKALAGSIIGSGEGWLTELSTRELKNLVSLRGV